MEFNQETICTKTSNHLERCRFACNDKLLIENNIMETCHIKMQCITECCHGNSTCLLALIFFGGGGVSQLYFSVCRLRHLFYARYSIFHKRS